MQSGKGAGKKGFTRKGAVVHINSSAIDMSSSREYNMQVSMRTSYLQYKGDASGENVTADTDYFRNMIDFASGEKDSGKENGDTEASEALSYSGVAAQNRIESYEKRVALKEVRDMCLQYLWRLLFGKKESGNDKDSLFKTITGLDGYSSTMQEMANYTTLVKETSFAYSESESTTYSTQGTAITADGRELSFNLEVGMSRSFEERGCVRQLVDIQLMDPLVINLHHNTASVSDQKFFFDLDADGEQEEISMLSSDSGYLTLDKNHDGKVNDGSELFGTKSGDGFSDLMIYDEDGNGWIDEADEIFDKLKIWTRNEKGEDVLYTLKEAGVGAICLQHSTTEFSLNSEKTNEVNAQVRSTGIFLYENGNVGTVQQLDLAT